MSEETRADLPILAFDNAAALEVWIAMQPHSSKGIWLQLAKKGSGMVSVSRSEAIDVGLCHGWIDGQQHPYDETRWLVRFTPRRRASKWSQINRARALELIREGRVRPAGMAEIEAAQANGRWDAAYAPASAIEVPDDLRQALDASPPAASAFAVIKADERYAILYTIANAKRPETRVRQIAKFVSKLQTPVYVDPHVGASE